MLIRKLFAVVSLSLLTSVASAAPKSNADLKKEVALAERAFAATMKARDHAAFVSFLSDEAVFFSGPVPLHGKKAVGDFWKKLYVEKEAPFSWEPDETEVLASGKLAWSSGPVYGPDGKLVARFNSVWRLEQGGKWKIIFDHGAEVCDCKKPIKE